MCSDTSILETSNSGRREYWKSAFLHSKDPRACPINPTEKYLLLVEPLISLSMAIVIDQGVFVASRGKHHQPPRFVDLHRCRHICPHLAPIIVTELALVIQPSLSSSLSSSRSFLTSPRRHCCPPLVECPPFILFVVSQTFECQGLFSKASIYTIFVELITNLLNRLRTRLDRRANPIHHPRASHIYTHVGSPHPSDKYIFES
jgi:hypothetical protein